MEKDFYDASSMGNSEYLEHHGIKGQKWGVRRFQNEDGSYTSSGKKRYGINGTGKTRKELNAEKKQLAGDKYKELTKDVEKMRQKAIEYGQKHNLDLDDGGGGDPKAGRHYMKMWEKIDQVEAQADYDAGKYATDEFIRKYGKTTLDKLNSANANVAAGKAVAAAALAIAGGVLISKIKQQQRDDEIYKIIGRK